MTDNEPNSINELLLSECKSLQVGGGGNIPFPTGGSGWGSSQIFSSNQAWDSYIDSQYGFSTGHSIEKYRQLVGDLGHNGLIMAEYRFLSNSIPEAPLQVKEKVGKSAGQHGESKIVENHELVKLWQRPNGSYTGVDLLKGIAFSTVLQGNAYVIKFMNNAGNKPLELWWEPHWTIRPMMPMNGAEFIDHYEVNRNGQWYEIPVENVIHIRDGIHPYNQRLGLTGNDSVLPELFGDAEAANYYATLMAGSGVPNFAVSIDKDRKLTDETIKQLEARLVEKTSGVKKGQPLIFHGGRPFKLGLNPREMDLRETRYMAEDRFCAAKGVPAVVLELGTGQAHSIYNNVNMAMERAWRSYVCPKLTMIENALNLHLLEDYEGKDSNRYCMHDLSQIQALQEDQDAKAKRLGALYTTGGIMRSELRSGMGYGFSVDNDEEVDKVFFVSRGGVLVKPSEQPVTSGEQIVDMQTGEIRVGAPAPPVVAPNAADALTATDTPFGKKPATAVADAKKQPLRLVKALVDSLSDEDDDTDETKSMPTGKSGLTSQDVQSTISWLKKIRMTKAAELMQAGSMTKQPSKKSNGDSKLLGTT